MLLLQYSLAEGRPPRHVEAEWASIIQAPLSSLIPARSEVGTDVDSEMNLYFVLIDYYCDVTAFGWYLFIQPALDAPAGINDGLANVTRKCSAKRAAIATAENVGFA